MKHYLALAKKFYSGLDKIPSEVKGALIKIETLDQQVRDAFVEGYVAAIRELRSSEALAHEIKSNMAGLSNTNQSWAQWLERDDKE